MRSIKKKLTSKPAALVLLVALLMTACASGESESDDQEAAATESESEPTESEASDPDEPVEGSDPVTLALLAPLTSGNSGDAQGMENAATLAVDEYNASGAACQMTLEVYDNRGTPEESTRVAQRALTVDGAEVIVGTYASAEALAVRELAERQETAFIATTGISPAITADAEYTFRTSVTTNDYPTAFVALMEQLGVNSPAMTHDDGPVGGGLSGPIAEEIEAQGIEFAGDPVGYPLDAPDLTATIQQVVDQEPDSLIHIGSSAADAGLVVKTAVEQGLNVPAMGFSSLASADALDIGGAAYDEMDVYTVFNVDPSKPEYQDFLESYTAEFGESENLAETVPQTYDAVKVIGAALNETGCDASGPVLVEAIHALPPQPAASSSVGQMLSYDGTQDGFSDVVMTPFQLVDGTLTPLG